MKLNEIDIQPYETLLLDRDGTINVHLVGDYVKRWEEFEFIPGILDVMPVFAKHFKHIFIVTNQRGVGRGILTEADLKDIHRLMTEEIVKAGGRIDGIYYCTALSNQDERRKPGRGLFYDILTEHPDVVPETTLMVGDSDDDMKFAFNCGVSGIKIDSLKKEGGKYKWVKTK